MNTIEHKKRWTADEWATFEAGVKRVRNQQPGMSVNWMRRLDVLNMCQTEIDIDRKRTNIPHHDLKSIMVRVDGQLFPDAIPGELYVPRNRPESNGIAQKVAEAEGSSQRFTQLLAEYERAPAVTRERLYLETVELVLRNSKKVIVDTKGNNNMLYLPLDRMVTPQGSVTVRDVTPETTIRAVTPSGQAQGPQDPARARGTR